MQGSRNIDSLFLNQFFFGKNFKQCTKILGLNTPSYPTQLRRPSDLWRVHCVFDAEFTQKHQSINFFLEFFLQNAPTKIFGGVENTPLTPRCDARAIYGECTMYLTPRSPRSTQTHKAPTTHQPAPSEKIEKCRMIQSSFIDLVRETRSTVV